jgi:HK97 family phage major capsid protein
MEYKNSAEVREKRAALYADTKSWLEKVESEGKPESEVEVEWSKRNADLTSMDEEAARLERRERLASLESEMNRPASRVITPTPEPTPTMGRSQRADRTLSNWLLAGSGYEDRTSTALQRNASAGLSLDRKQFNFSIAEAFEVGQRAVLTSGVGAGKELSPVGLPTTFAEYMRYVCPIMDFATIENTTDTRVYPYPVLDNTGNKGFVVAEGALIADKDFATKTININAVKYASGIQKLSIEFLRSAVGNIENRVGKMLSEAIAAGFAADCFSSTNTSTAPQGLLNAATVNATLATRGTLTADAVIDLLYSVPQPYDQNVTLVMHKTTVAAIRKLKDSNGRYLWQESFAAGQPPTVMGYPVLVSSDMPTLATTGANPIMLAGDLRGYVVRVAGDVTVQRSDDRYMEYGLVAFSALQFLDGRWVGPSNALRALNNPAT